MLVCIFMYVGAYMYGAYLIDLLMLGLGNIAGFYIYYKHLKGWLNNNKGAQYFCPTACSAANI